MKKWKRKRGTYEELEVFLGFNAYLIGNEEIMPFSLHAYLFCFSVGIKYNLIKLWNLSKICIFCPLTWAPATIFVSINTTCTAFLAAVMAEWVFTLCWGNEMTH